MNIQTYIRKISKITKHITRILENVFCFLGNDFETCSKLHFSKCILPICKEESVISLDLKVYFAIIQTHLEKNCIKTNNIINCFIYFLLFFIIKYEIFLSFKLISFPA